MAQTVFTVPNISCSHCTATIERVVGELEGVQSVRADVESKRVEVVFESPATQEAIVEAMTEWDYPPAS